MPQRTCLAGCVRPWKQKEDSRFGTNQVDTGVSREVAVWNVPHVRQVEPDCAVAGFIDVETTGLSPRFDQVVEFALVLFSFRMETGEITGTVDEYVALRDPGRPIPPGAMAVHGIRDADVRGRELDPRRIRSLMDQAEFLVAHNAGFDRSFVAPMFREAREKPWYCSMNHVPWRQLGFRSRGLQSLLRDHGIRVERAHRGGDDVKATLRLLGLTDPGGTYYFKYLVDRVERADASGRAGAHRADSTA